VIDPKQEDKPMSIQRFASISLVVLLMLAGVASVAAQPDLSPSQDVFGSAFTYQGYIEDGGAPANGVYNLQFSLWDALAAGAQVGTTQTKTGVTVSDGLFTVRLDFGGVFNGAPLWLQINVQGPSDPSYTALDPRQELTPVPYAVNADRLDGLDAVAFASYVHNHAGQSWAAGDVPYGLSVSGTSSTGSGLIGANLSVSGVATGVLGNSSSTDGRGVAGINTATSGAAYGVYGETSSVSGAGVYGVNNGVTGNIAVGVYGVSNADDGRGVFGIGRVGVMGFSFDTPGAGISGANYSSTGATTGVAGRSDSTTGRGVRGEATSTTGTNYGVMGISESAAGFDFYANGAGTNYGAFTGAHEVKLDKSFPEEFQPGMIVSATGKAQVRNAPDRTVSLSSTLPTVRLADSPEDRTVFGVLVAEITLPEDHWYEAKTGERFASVNALGEGRVWVSNIRGEIHAGDYITTSAIPGYGQRQSDDLLHSYTLGKVIESANWDQITDTIRFDGQTYKVYLLAVVYTSG
jgi:hypothetical protein